MGKKRTKKKARRKRFLVEATLGPMEKDVVAGMFRPGSWYVIDEDGGWHASEDKVHDVDVMYAADEREIDSMAANAMDTWEEMRPGHRWSFHVSTVVRDRQTGDLRRKP